MDSTVKKEKLYAYEEFQEFVNNATEGQHYEWADGVIYMSPSPAREHQRISRFLTVKIGSYLEGKTCELYYAPMDLNLLDEKTKKPVCTYQPDIMVVCDESKFGDNSINGSPDLIIEIASPSNSKHDYLIKFNDYMRFGVKEYWIVDPRKRQINVYINSESNIELTQYAFNDKIKVGIFEDLVIDFNEYK